MDVFTLDDAGESGVVRHGAITAANIYALSEVIEAFERAVNTHMKEKTHVS